MRLQDLAPGDAWVCHGEEDYTGVMNHDDGYTTTVVTPEAMRSENTVVAILQQKFTANGWEVELAQ